MATDAVTDMAGMFNQAHGFNRALNSWRTSSVTGMAAMFLGAKKFNQPLNSWQTGGSP